MTHPLVTIERARPAVAVLTINRPERLNALSMPTITALKDAFAEVGADRETKVVVVTGAGRGFCAGLDLKEVGPSPVGDGLDGVASAMRGQAYFGDVVQRVRAVPQPVIAAVNGVAVGGGLAIAMACDLRIAASSARFNVQALRLGLSAGETGLSFHLTHLAPAGIPFELLLTNRFFDAQEGARIGLIHQVTPDDQVVDAALAVAAALTEHDRDALALAKQTMWTNLTAPSLEAALAVEARMWALPEVEHAR